VLHRVKVEPVKLRGFSDLTGCDTLRVIGYRPTCSCGYRGRVAKTVQIARARLHDHRANL